MFNQLCCSLGLLLVVLSILLLVLYYLYLPNNQTPPPPSLISCSSFVYTGAYCTHIVLLINILFKDEPRFELSFLCKKSKNTIMAVLSQDACTILHIIGKMHSMQLIVHLCIFKNNCA